MMKIMKWLRLTGDYGLDLQERLFRLIVYIGVSGLLMGTCVGAAAGESMANIVSLAGSAVIFALLAFAAIRSRRIQPGAVIISVYIIVIVLPLNFFTAGGINGGASILYLFGLVFVCLVVKGKAKFVLLAGGYASYLACSYCAYLYPEKIVRHSPEMIYTDTIATFTVVLVIICCMILFQNAVYEAENKTAQEQTKEIEDLNRAQNRFFSSMSHEIRTPINTIIGLNEMILRSDVSDEVAEDARNIQGAGKMLLTLINDILDMSKIESGKMDIVPVTYDVGAMLSDIVNMIWVRAKDKGLEFHIDVDETIPAQLYGDEVRIKQILINLLNNAVKYTSEGSVTLSVQCRKMDDGSVEASYSVSDTGMGIKKENIPYLFQAFKRVDEEKNRFIEGTGLGLSIVKQLVDLMGGEIAVNSIYMNGSTFVVTIPQGIVGEAMLGNRNLETRHALNAREHYKPVFEAPKANVLIVDDNEMNLMVAKKLLGSTKVGIDTATGGEECLRRTALKHYDVIFMDHLMPGMDGIECLHEIRSQTGGLAADTPVIALTANAGGENQALYKREGFDGYLVKPVSGIQLETELLRQLPKALVKMVSAADGGDMAASPVLGHRRKLPVMVTTDSVCDLPKTLTVKNQIAVLPYHVLTSGGRFMDGREIESDGVLAYMEDVEKWARSEEPGVQDYEKFFAEQLTKAQHIIHIAMGKHASKGYENSLKASRTFDNVTVFDSGHLSSGMGLIVLQAAHYAAEGMTVDAILEELRNMRRRVRTSFIVSSTKYLARSGRISARVNAICEACMLHPTIVLKNSSMKVGAIRIGTEEAIRRKYIYSTLKTAAEIDTKLLFITYAGLRQEDLKEIEEYVRRKVDFEQIIFQKASPAISTNCGPGCFGLLFAMKR